MAVVLIVAGVALVVGAKWVAELFADLPLNQGPNEAFGGRGGAVFFNRVVLTLIGAGAIYAGVSDFK